MTDHKATPLTFKKWKIGGCHGDPRSGVIVLFPQFDTVSLRTREPFIGAGCS
jgi:hypothetical protein